MATWNLENEGDDVVLTYEDGVARKPCGRGAVELLPELLGWVVEQAAPWDRVRTARAVFVRQAGPKRTFEPMLS